MRSPFVILLPGEAEVPMAFPVDTPLGDVILAAAQIASDMSADVQIVRDENERTPLGTVHPDGSWTEA